MRCGLVWPRGASACEDVQGKQAIHVNVEAVVFGERLQQLSAKTLIKKHHARAAGHCVTQVQAAAALLGEPNQIL